MTLDVARIGLKIQAQVILLWLFLSLAVGLSHAQAPIDPSLPEAPLAHKRDMILFSGYGTVRDPQTSVPPLSTSQKYELAYRKTIDPATFLRGAFVSGFDEALNVGPDYGPGMGGFGKLYAYNLASIASSNLFADAFIPSLVHQDPRYFRKGSGSAKSRIWWAIRSQFVAFSDSGKPMPNYGTMIGLSMSTGLAAAYLPPENVSFGQTMEGIAIKIGTSAGLDTVREFGGFAALLKGMKKHKAD
jgi:hypothetical protein